MMDNCMSLPLTLLFFMIFFYVSCVHFDLGTQYSLTLAQTQEIRPDLLVPEYPASLWTWAESRAEVARIARFNKLIGGMRVVQAPPEADKDPPPTVICGLSALK